MRTPIVAGNWKMNAGGRASAEALANAVVRGVEAVRGVEVVLAPPYPALAFVAEIVRGTNVALAAQNVHFEAAGAYTGEVAPSMLADVGCAYCIVGHSERRQLFGETDENVNRRAKALLSARIRPILCVGETLAEREGGVTFRVLETQMRGAFAGLTESDLANVVVAYEPVWAIGTGRNASPEQAQEAHAFLRGWLSKDYGAEAAAGVRIQYGGSVKPSNVDELMAEADIDGALVGGASLDAESFVRIVRFQTGDHR
jgi:triosephosphate isomerase